MTIPSGRSNPPAGFRDSIELARFVAAFGVVMAHAVLSPKDLFGHAALSLFLILTAYLMAQSFLRIKGPFSLWPRVKRLLLPWLFWSAFYRIVNLRVSDDPDRFSLLTDPWTLLSGGSFHLWFLPFVAVAMLFVAPVGRFVQTPIRLMIAIAVLLAFSFPIIYAHEYMAWPAPIPQWLYSIPSYGLGLLLGFAKPLGRQNWVVALAALMSVSAYVITKGAFWSPALVLSVLAFMGFWRVDVTSQVMAKLGKTAFGIYLLHPFFMLVVYKFCGSGVNLWLAGILCFLITWPAVVVLRKFRWGKILT